MGARDADFFVVDEGMIITTDTAHCICSVRVVLSNAHEPVCLSANLAGSLKEAGLALRLPPPDFNFKLSRDIPALSDGTLLSVVGVVTRVGPVMRSPAWDPDFVSEPYGDDRAAGEVAEIYEEDGVVDTSPVLGTAPRRPVNAQLRGGTNAQTVIGKLAPHDALGRDTYRGLWTVHRLVWIRDGTSEFDVVLKIFPNSRVVAFRYAAPCAWFQPSVVPNRARAVYALSSTARISLQWRDTRHVTNGYTHENGWPCAYKRGRWRRSAQGLLSRVD